MLRRPAARLVPLGLTALVLLAPRAAPAYRCARVGTDSGPSQYWDTRTIGWYADAAGTPDIADKDLVLRTVRESFQVWTDVECTDLTLDFLGAEMGLRAGFNPSAANKNVVAFVNQGWEYGEAIIAVTTNSFDPRTGLIYDADIELNDQSFQFVAGDATCAHESGSMDVANTLVHEAGHLLGLDHPPNTQRYADTTMFASAPPCETKKRSLEEDDLAGICAIYPAGKPTAQCFPPTGPSFLVVDSDDGFGCATTGGRASGGEILGLILLGALVRRGCTFRRDQRRPCACRGGT